MFRWSTCQADHFSSSESEDDDISIINDDIDKADFNESWEAEVEEIPKTRRIYQSEALNKLRQNDGDEDLTVNEFLQDVTHDSLNNLSSQGHEAKVRKANNLKRKLVKLKKKTSKYDKSRLEKFGTDIFLSESQDSFIEYIKEELKDKHVEDDSDFEVEETSTKDVKSVYRKSFN